MTEPSGVSPLRTLIENFRAALAEDTDAEQVRQKTRVARAGDALRRARNWAPPGGSFHKDAPNEAPSGWASERPIGKQVPRATQWKERKAKEDAEAAKARDPVERAATKKRWDAFGRGKPATQSEAIKARDMDAAIDTAAEAAKTGKATTIHVHKNDPTNVQVQVHGSTERASAHPGADYRPADFGASASRIAKGGKGAAPHAGLSRLVGAGVKSHLKGVPIAKAKAQSKAKAKQQSQQPAAGHITKFPSAPAAPEPLQIRVRPKARAMGEALAAFIEARALVEAYAPKREPDERQQDYQSFKQKMLGRYQGRDHKGGRSTRSTLRFYAGKSDAGDAHDDARRKAENRPSRSSERHAVAQDQSRTDKAPSVRQGLSKGRPSGFMGKTAIDKSKARMKGSQPAAEPPAGAVGWRRYKPGTSESPSALDVKKRAEDPAAGAAAKAAAAAARLRMKVLGRKPATKVEWTTADQDKVWSAASARAKHTSKTCPTCNGRGSGCKTCGEHGRVDKKTGAGVMQYKTIESTLGRTPLVFEGTLGAARAERKAKAVGKETAVAKLADLKQRIRPFRPSSDWGQDADHPMNQRAKAAGAQASSAVLRKSERGGSAERRAVERDRAQAAHHRSDHEGGQRDAGYTNRIHVHNRWQGKPGDRGPFESPARDPKMVADKNKAVARLKELPGHSFGGARERVAAAKKNLLAKRAARSSTESVQQEGFADVAKRFKRTAQAAVVAGACAIGGQGCAAQQHQSPDRPSRPERTMSFGQAKAQTPAQAQRDRDLEPKDPAMAAYARDSRAREAQRAAGQR